VVPLAQGKTVVVSLLHFYARGHKVEEMVKKWSEETSGEPVADLPGRLLAWGCDWNANTC
jgi:hypothetical protein